MKTINFDMDGTLANLYGCDNWLKYLRNEQTKPYREAPPMVNMRRLARILNKLKAYGFTINIISWGSMTSSGDYLKRTEKAKKDWLKRHLGSVKFDNIYIVPYGTDKGSLADGYLFDDEERNRKNWLVGKAFDEKNIIENLNLILQNQI